MTTPMLAVPLPWGDRTELLPKRMLYALSLDLTAVVNGSHMVVGKSVQRGLRHLLDDVVVMMPEGLRCDVPIGAVEGGEGEIGASDDPSSTSLRLRVRANLGDPGLLNIECTGVINFNGGPAVMRTPSTGDWSGSSFISTRFETASATYRWLNRRQLYGIGRVKGSEKSGRRLLSFSFDLYSAA